MLLDFSDHTRSGISKLISRFKLISVFFLNTVDIFSPDLDIISSSSIESAASVPIRKNFLELNSKQQQISRSSSKNNNSSKVENYQSGITVDTTAFSIAGMFDRSFIGIRKS